jgi:hypothetical protein
MVCSEGGASVRSQAEPPEPGNERFGGGDQREVS